MSDVKFVDGMIFKQRHQNAPDFVKGGLSIKVADFAQWVKQWKADNPGEEWINIQLKVSANGKPYAQLDEWKPQQQAQQDQGFQPKAVPGDDIPFS